MNYYPHHLGDYAKDTGHLSLLEHGAYRLLLDHYYSTEMPLPAAPAALQRICRAVTKSEREAVALVAGQFFRLNDGKLHHGRVEKEIEEYAKKRERNSANGKNGGRPPKPKQNPNETHSVISGLSKRNPNESNAGAFQEPVTSNHVLLEKEPKSARVAEFADEIYEAYPKRVGKPDAIKRIKTALNRPPEGVAPQEWPTELLAITRRYAALRKDEPPQFTPNPATWFNQRRFEDDPATWAANANANGNGTHHTVEALF